MSAFVTADIYKCMYLYTMVVPPTGRCTECLLATNYTIVDVLVVHTGTLYYTSNIPRTGIFQFIELHRGGGLNGRLLSCDTRGTDSARFLFVLHDKPF